MRSYIVKSRSILIILMSATAVSFGYMRLADLAFILFAFTLIVTDFKFTIDKLSYALIFVLATVGLSTCMALLYGRDVLISNAIAVPASIFISLVCLVFVKPAEILEIIHEYPAYLIGLILLVGFAEVIGVDVPWIVYDEEMNRFSALSQNPNQLALYLLPIPFFSLISYIEKRKNKKIVFFELSAAIIINIFVIGKTLFIGWIVSFAFLFLIGFIYVGKLKIDYSKIILKLFFLLLASLTLLPLIFALYKGDTAGSVEGQGEDRVALWWNGLYAWFDSFLLGHGPGHYSGIEAAYQNMEAHNLWIDWLSAYGYIGGCALGIYLVMNLIKIINAEIWILVSLYISLFVQTTFHFYGRQPFFWLLLIISYLSASELVRKNSKE